MTLPHFYLFMSEILLLVTLVYRIYPAIRRGFCAPKITSIKLISPMKFCNNTNFTLPKQSQRSRSVLQDGSRSLGLFWKEKFPSYNKKKYGITLWFFVTIH